ncbi:MAG: penicillin-binding protein 1C, partial [Candidatus Peribacteraceae bacterium]|nr:penicillin-binding protein 1C [Candidatus Peribacteraceae bacterium]
MRRRHLLWLLPLLTVLSLLLLPLPDSFLKPKEGSLRILDRNGQLLYELRKPDEGLSKPLTLSQVPKPFIAALLAIEDRSFYAHSGISARGILRALWQNVSSGHVVSGGSTLTQQLVRNLSGSRDRTLDYKMKEAFLAMKIEQKYSKDQILELYINTAYFGHQAYGLAAASQTFFGKSPHELSVAECAFLAGLPQSPSSYDPFAHFGGAEARQERVLTAMQETGDLTEAEAVDARRETLTLAEDRISLRAPHFVMWLLGEHPEIADDAANVTTTLDLNLQTEIERIMTRNLEKLKDKNVTSAAVVVLDAHTGDLLSMVGSSDYFNQDLDGAVNVAVSPRQPGSALKPFTYALALTKGDTAATTVADTEAQFFTQEGNPYTPRNYDFGYHGLVRYREALANSYNIAAVRVLEKLGVQSLLSFLHAAGITTLTESPEHYGLALTLGDGEVTLLELTQAYGIFPRGGRTLIPRALPSSAMKDGIGILDPKVAWLITNILSDQSARLPEYGEDGPLNFDFPVAAKTGTTRNSRDNWTIGYTPDVLVGVWVGNADNSPMKDTSGVTGAGPVFHDVMLEAVKNHPPRDFPMPQDIIK